MSSDNNEKLQSFLQDNKSLNEVVKALSYEEFNFDKLLKERYDEYQGRLTGRSEKIFLRVENTPFNHLVAEVQNNPDCSYVSYANKVIKDGVIPEKFSVLIKNEKHVSPDARDLISYSVSEVIASRVLNFYNCPTVYNVAATTEEDGEIQRKLISVDCISENEEFLTIVDLGLDPWSRGLENIVFKLSEMLEPYSRDDKTKQKVIDDYILSYFVRKFILVDSDFDNRNVGILINRKDKHIKLVNFDLEFSCVFAASNEYKDYVIQDILGYLKSTSPRIYEKFVEKTKQIVKYMSTNTNNIEIKNSAHQNAVKLIINNCKYILEQVAIIEKTNLSEMMK